MARELSGWIVPITALADITGKPRIIDGDTIEIGGARIRLHGIDAPEAGRERQSTWGTGTSPRLQHQGQH